MSYHCLLCKDRIFQNKVQTCNPIKNEEITAKRIFSMNAQNRRFVFIDFENLRKIKFKKLEKVATKIFVFISEEVDNIPAFLVYQIQKLGKDVKWIVVDNSKKDKMNYHMAFLMGKLHQKLHADVEFAVLSNDEDFDPLVGFINSQNRNCIRVQRKPSKDERKAEKEIVEADFSSVSFSEEETAIFPEAEYSNGHVQDIPEATTAPPTAIEAEYDNMIASRTAEETMKRLERSGNRPAEVDTLKHYILLNNQELSVHGNIDKVIERMEASKKINVQQTGEVIYHF